MKTMILVLDININNGDPRGVAENIGLCEKREHLEKYLKDNNVQEDEYELYLLEDFAKAFNNEQINEVESYIGIVNFK